MNKYFLTIAAILAALQTNASIQNDFYQSNIDEVNNLILLQTPPENRDLMIKVLLTNSVDTLSKSELIKSQRILKNILTEMLSAKPLLS